MSIEMFVLSDRKLASIAAWQQAIDQEGFDLRLDTSRPFEQLAGYLPAKRGEHEAGFECDHWDPADILDEEYIEPIDFGPHRWTQALAFRIGGNFFELWGSSAAAAAYARATGGVVFDSESGEVMQPDRAAEIARQNEEYLKEHGLRD